MRRADGITRTEVLVVVLSCAALATAVFIFMPPNRERPYSGHGMARCLTNLDALRKSMAGYASENKGKYPFPTDNPSIQAYTNQNDGLAWFAREMGVQGRMFVCSTTDDLPLLTDLDIGEAANDGYSYAYQAPFLNAGVLEVGVNENTPNDVVFLGDKPPAEVSPIDWGSLLSEGQTIEELRENDPTRSRLMAGMSSHHGDGVVMMVASKAGVMKVGRGDVGFENDAIFMGGGPARMGTPAKTITDRRDSLLLRPDGR